MRLRITTGPRTEPKSTVTGQHLIFELYTPGGPPLEAPSRMRLDNVSSVTLHCAGRHEAVTAVLVIKGVDLDLDLPLAPEASAALALLR